MQACLSSQPELWDGGTAFEASGVVPAVEQACSGRGGATEMAGAAEVGWASTTGVTPNTAEDVHIEQHALKEMC